MNRKIITGAIIVIIVLAIFSGCSHPVITADRPLVVATNFAMYDFSRAVCGDKVQVKMAIAPGEESHDFEVTMSDISSLSKAIAVIYVGGESDEWVEDVLETMDSDKAKPAAFRAMDKVVLYKEDAFDEAIEEDEYDEHIWTSPKNAILIVKGISEMISGILPEFSSYFEDNAEKYIEELTRLDKEFSDLSSATKEVILADRYPFKYLSVDYGIKFKAAFSGCTSNTEPTLSKVNELVRYVANNDVKTIFIIEFSDGKTAEIISKETGARIETLYSAHNVTEEDFNSGITYVDLMDHNIKVLKEVLK